MVAWLTSEWPRDFVPLYEKLKGCGWWRQKAFRTIIQLPPSCFSKEERILKNGVKKERGREWEISCYTSHSSCFQYELHTSISDTIWKNSWHLTRLVCLKCIAHSRQVSLCSHLHLLLRINTVKQDTKTRMFCVTIQYNTMIISANNHSSTSQVETTFT